MDKNEIITSVIRFEIKLGKQFEQYLSLSEMAITMRMKVNGPIKAGQLLSATGPDPLLKHSDALAAVGEDENAIKSYDKVIELFPGTEAAVAAMNNKGLIFLKNKKTVDAIPLFKEVINHEFAEKVALFNLARCYAIDNKYELIEETCNLLNEKNLDDPENIDNFKQQLLKHSQIESNEVSN